MLPVHVSQQMCRGFVRASKPRGQLKGQKIRIVSYNILADKYATSGHHGYCAYKFLDWSYRWPRIASELLSYNADIMCLQEVEAPVYQQQLQPLLKSKGYSGMYHPRPCPPNVRGPEEGISLFYRTSMFNHISNQALVFAEQATAILPSSAGSEFSRVLARRGEGALLALLEHKLSKQVLLACTTHLFYSPEYPDVKVAQAAVLCASISAWLQQQLGRQDVPVIVAGDFNSLWQKYESDNWDKVPAGHALTSGVYELLSTGSLAPDHPDHPSQRNAASCSSSSSRSTSKLVASTAEAAAAAGRPRSGHGPGGKHQPSPPASGLEADPRGGYRQWDLCNHVFTTAGLLLSSSYYQAHGREPPLTTRTSTFSGTLDYIWLSRQHWEVTATLDLPYQDPKRAVPASSIRGFPPIPDALRPSDHVALGCDVLLLSGGRQAADPAAEADDVEWEYS